MANLPQDADPAVELRRAIGRSARRQRVEQNLSQAAVGARADLHRNYVGAIERGEINATLAVLSKLAIGLDCRLSDLVTDAELIASRPSRK